MQVVVNPEPPTYSLRGISGNIPFYFLSLVSTSYKTYAGFFV